MELTAAVCNQCGASLSVPQSSRFVTCLHCGSQLEIKRTESVCYTEIARAVGEQTERLENQLERLNVHQELEALDREWQIQQDQFGESGKRANDASAVGNVLGGILAIGFLIFWTIMAGSHVPVFGLFGLLGIGVVVANMLSSAAARSRFETARTNYESRRQSLMNKVRQQTDA